MEVYSVGHSTLDIENFLAALEAHHVTAIADVRSSPYSRNSPQFNREKLKTVLSNLRIAYVFLGKELGGRPKDHSLYTNGVADYEKMAATEEFNSGITRLEQGAKNYRIAMLCSERNPLDCHRCLLVGRILSERGVCVEHIVPGLPDQSQGQIEQQLLSIAKVTENDMFASPRDRLNGAYRERARRVAYSESEGPGSKKASLG
jgi:uncharacterized protein (DUF488 family)